ncbi:MAG: alpha/beta hydrolase [Prochloraceae cyanobacterium]|nr:alpha/beta hydrolase [Prochloraceae cyanobacterium]
MSIKFLILLMTTSYHAIATWIEDSQYKPPGQLIDIGGYKLHLYSQGKGNVTVVIDHSLGGLDGYFLIKKIAKITRVCIYDRPGYGWSDPSPKKRCSEEVVRELDTLLSRAGIEPPYILVGDSFGSYNVRLYAHYFPEKVVGIVLTDGLHEKEMLKMSPLLTALKLFFISGFIMSALGSILGIVRILGNIGIFELIKKELRQFPSQTLGRVKRSFYSYQHWITMWREMWNLDASARQVSKANNLSNIPIVSIKSSTFIRRSLLNFYMPLKAADRLRDKMHAELLKLSTNSTQIKATKSSHFVWVDEPETIASAIQQLLQKIKARVEY